MDNQDVEKEIRVEIPPKTRRAVLVKAADVPKPDEISPALRVLLMAVRDALIMVTRAIEQYLGMKKKRW
jgi:hypothetical protein